MRSTPTWRGIFPAVCTPFDAREAVDLDAMRRVVRFVLECGAHGIVCFGLAGEGSRLAHGERRDLLETILDEAAGRVPVLAGVGAESLPATVELARHAAQAGAHGVVVTAPAGNPGDAAVAAYLARVAEAAELPVMVQDAPAYLGVALAPTAVVEAARLAPNICLAKLEGGPARMSGWLDALGPGFSVWGGDGGIFTLDSLRLGAAGIVPGSDLVDRLVAVWESERRGAHAEAEAGIDALLATLTFELQSIDHYNACAKRVLIARGVLESATVRSPAAQFPAASEDLLRRHVARLGL